MTVETRVEDPGATPPLVSVVLLFFVNGAVYSSWISRLPEIREQAGLTLGSLGVVLATAGVTGIVGSAVSGRIVQQVGSRRATIMASVPLVAFMPLIGLGESAWLLVPILMTMAFFDTITDIAMNVQASAVDAARPVPVISRIHGVWSLGALIGGAVASRVADAGISLGVHLVVVGTVLAVAIAVAAPGFLRNDVAPDEASSPTTARGRWRIIGVLSALGFLALVIEMIPAEWATLRLTEDLDASPGTAGLAFVAFMGGMVVGRMGADFVAVRIGSFRMTTMALATSIAGVLAFTIIDVIAVALVALAFAGLGASIIFPQIYGQAARVPGISAGRSLGYMTTGMRIAVLSVPPAVGFIAESANDNVALAIAVVVVPSATCLFFALVRLFRITEVPDRPPVQARR